MLSMVPAVAASAILFQKAKNIRGKILTFAKIYNISERRGLFGPKTVAEEVLSLIRVVNIFNAQEFEVSRYCTNIVLLTD